MGADAFAQLPGRVFMDTCLVNFILDFGEQIHDNAPMPTGLSVRACADIEALRNMFATGQRAAWQLAVSPLTYREVIATNDAERAHALEGWFSEIWHYWREWLRTAGDLPSFYEAEEERLRLLTSGVLDILPDAADRVLLCDAVVYRCDAFCTRDWSTILRYRDNLSALPLRVITPAEWWEEIAPWAGIWL